MSDFSGELVADATLDDAYTKPRGWLSQNCIVKIMTA